MFPSMSAEQRRARLARRHRLTAETRTDSVPAVADSVVALHRTGPSTARALGKAVPALTQKLVMGGGKYAAPQAAHTRLLLLLGFDGDIVRTVTSGSWVSSEYEWSVAADWLPEPFAGADPVAARRELAGRYLRQFGPVTTADLQWWAGWTLGATRAAIDANGAVVHELVQAVDARTRKAIAAEAERVRAVIGDARVTPRFPAPLQQSLAG